MRGKVRDNEVLLLTYLSCLDASTAILPGGYRIAGEVSPTQDVAVEKLMPKSRTSNLSFAWESRIA